MATVSVIIPTYDRRDYVQEAIDSVLAQTYKDYEIIVIDDGSNDGTGSVLADRYGGQIIYQWQENAGEAAARNKAIQLAKGDLIATLDSDDRWLANKLERQVRVFAENPDIVAVFSDVQTIDSNGNVIRSRPARSIPPEELTFEFLCINSLIGNPLSSATPTALFRSGVARAVGGFDEQLRLGEDYDFWLKLRQVGPFFYISEQLAEYRIHQSGQHLQRKKSDIEERLQSTKKILDRAFANSGEQISQRTRDQAYASVNGHVGCMYIAQGYVIEGKQILEVAIEQDPRRWNKPLFIARYIQRQQTKVMGINSVVTSVEQTVEVISSILPLSSEEKRNLVSTLLYDTIWANHDVMEPGEIRQCLSNAIRRSPNLLVKKATILMALNSFHKQLVG